MTQRNITVGYSSVWDPSVGDDDADEPKQALQSISRGQSSNFVAPLARPTQAQPLQAQGFDLSGFPVVNTSSSVDASDELTRARGFTLRTMPLALGFAFTVGGVVLIAGSGWWAIPASFAVFAIVWAVAFVAHLQRSPAGVAWFQARSMWAIVRDEQKHRHAVDWFERGRNR